MNSSTEVRVTCSQCGAYLIAEMKDRGRKATCPECGGVFVIEPPFKREKALYRPVPPPEKPASDSETALKLKDDLPPAKPSKPAPAKQADHIPRIALLTTESHRTRAKLAGWLRRAIIVALALATLKVFETAFASLPESPESTLHATFTWLSQAIRAIPERLQLLTVEREVVLGRLSSLERFILSLGLVLYATRLMVRAKLIDAVYVMSPRWNERTVSGLIINFLALMLQAGLLGWTASMAKMPLASDGLVCGLVALILLVSGVWLATLHLMAGHEYPELTKWMLNDLICAFCILLVALWPGLTFLWSRAGATGILLLANSAVALHVGASFIFVRRPRRWWWHKPVSILVSLCLLLIAAVLMACVR